MLRMLVEKRLPLALSSLLQAAAALFAGNASFKDPVADVTAFLYDRLRGLLRERGYHAERGRGRASPSSRSVLDNIVERLQAVQAFAALPEAEALAAANKRITNILKKADMAGAGGAGRAAAGRRPSRACMRR